MNSWKARRPPAWELYFVNFKTLSCMRVCIPSVENVHEWDGQDVWLFSAGKVRDVGVERNLLFLSDTYS